MKFNIYTAWMDPIFYATAAIFALSLFFLVYSIRRYVELKNSDEFDETPAEDPASADWPVLETRDAIPPGSQPLTTPGRITEPEAAGTPGWSERDTIQAIRPEAAGRPVSKIIVAHLKRGNLAEPEAPDRPGPQQRLSRARDIFEETEAPDQPLSQLIARLKQGNLAKTEVPDQLLSQQCLSRARDIFEETEAPDQPGPQPDFSPAAEPHAPADSGSNRAETFVRGIYEELSGLDARLKNIEASVSKSRVNNDFTVKFLEDILSDLDALDKEKIKARIEYLLSDLKK